MKSNMVLLLILSLGLFTLPVNAQQGILIYHVYYNDVLIIQLEVIPDDTVSVKVVPLYDIDSRTFYAISDLLISPTKHRFVLQNIEDFAKDIHASFKQLNETIILEYKVNKFARKSVYDNNGILLRETNIYDDINISVYLVTVINNSLYYNTISITIPLAIVILGLAVYSYIRREYLRIL